MMEVVLLKEEDVKLAAPFLQEGKTIIVPIRLKQAVEHALLQKKLTYRITCDHLCYRFVPQKKTIKPS